MAELQHKVFTLHLRTIAHARDLQLLFKPRRHTANDVIKQASRRTPHGACALRIIRRLYPDKIFFPGDLHVIADAKRQFAQLSLGLDGAAVNLKINTVRYFHRQHSDA